MTKVSCILAARVMVGLVACGSDSLGPDSTPPLPTVLQATVTNPFFPLPLGRTLAYQTQTANGLEVDTIDVLAHPGGVNGFPVTEVHDRVYVAGSLTENTYDWYAQDPDGNVWYLGEDTKEYDHGVLISTEGTWQWGVHNALPGLIAWGDPHAQLNKLYRQELDRGNAQDVAKVVALDQSVTVPFGTFMGCVQTEEWSTLESGPHETKFYCPQIGVALEVLSADSTKLVSVTP